MRRILLLAALLAGEAPAADVKGHVATGAETAYPNDGRSDYEAKVKVKTKRDDAGRRAVVEVEGKGSEDAIRMTEAYVDQKGGLRFGYMEKTLGLEYERSGRERMTIKRSPLYDKLQDFAYVGAAPQVSYEGEHFRIAAGHANSFDAFLLGYAHWKDLGAWTLLQSDRVSNGFQKVWATGVALASDWYEAELMAGVDPRWSEFERTYGDGRTVTYAGAKLGLSLGPLVLQSTAIQHDTTDRRSVDVHGLVGLRHDVAENIRVGLEYETLLKTGKVHPHMQGQQRRNVRVEVRYDFD